MWYKELFSNINKTFIDPSKAYRCIWIIILTSECTIFQLLFKIYLIYFLFSRIMNNLVLYTGCFVALVHLFVGDRVD